MLMQSALDNFSVPNPHGTDRRPYLMSGRVTSPVPLTASEYETYVQRCLRTWSVDVVLDTGEYLQSCRVVQPQGNGREGVRRLPRLPQQTASGEVLQGDAVLVSFLYGSIAHPVILGTISPMADSRYSLEDLEQVQVTTRDINERQDRHEYVDSMDPETPLVTSYATRTTGLTMETEHRGQQRVDGVALAAQRLERHRGGRDVELEHVVQVDEGTLATIRHSNRSAHELRQFHGVRTEEGLSTVTIEDLQAQVLQLTHRVEALNTLILRSNRAESLVLQHKTPEFQTTVLSDSESRTLSLVAEDLTAESQAGLTVSREGETILRRVGSDDTAAMVRLSKDGSITVHNSSGPTIHLDESSALVTAGKSSITISNDNGISLTTPGGTMVAAFDDAVVVTSPTCTIASQSIHLQTGGLTIGPSPATAKFIPDAVKVELAIQALQTNLTALVTAFNTHVHTSAAPGSPTTPSMIRATPPAANLFMTARDALVSVKGS